MRSSCAGQREDDGCTGAAAKLCAPASDAVPQLHIAAMPHVLHCRGYERSGHHSTKHSQESASVVTIGSTQHALQRLVCGLCRRLRGRT